MFKTLYLIRVILWLSLAVFVGWLGWQVVVPSGQISYLADSRHLSDFISYWQPKERLIATGGTVKILADPIYFSLRAPRPFSKLTLTLQYKPADAKLLEVGLLEDKALWRYDLKPLYNRAINQLYRSQSWGILSDNQTILLQRQENYASVKQFLAKPPLASSIAVYNYSLPNNFHLADYRTGTGQTVTSSLRGAYQFFTYIKNETLAVDWQLVDLNQAVGSDEVVVVVTNANGQEVKQLTLPDDGVAAATGQASQRRSLSLNLPGLAEGFYKIDWRATDDIVTKKLTSRQSKLAFVGKLWLAEAGEKNIMLYTDANHLDAQTLNPASRQVIKVNQTSLWLAETYKKIGLDNDCSKVCQINLERGDVLLSGNGVFAFAPAALFNPQAKKVDNNFSLTSQTNYIIADYQPPMILPDGAYQSQVEFDLNGAPQDGSGYNIMIGAPGFDAAGNEAAAVEVESIKAEFQGKTWREFFNL
jgi:hypothetical protein